MMLNLPPWEVEHVKNRACFQGECFAPHGAAPLQRRAQVIIYKWRAGTLISGTSRSVVLQSSNFRSWFFRGPLTNKTEICSPARSENHVFRLWTKFSKSIENFWKSWLFPEDSQWKTALVMHCPAFHPWNSRFNGWKQWSCRGKGDTFFQKNETLES